MSWQDRKWILTLTDYHRENLLQLIEACGYPYGKGIKPFTFANSGDWLGELWIMCDGHERRTQPPNQSHEQLELNVEHWVTNEWDKMSESFDLFVEGEELWSPTNDSSHEVLSAALQMLIKKFGISNVLTKFAEVMRRNDSSLHGYEFFVELKSIIENYLEKRKSQ